MNKKERKEKKDFKRACKKFKRSKESLKRHIAKSNNPISKLFPKNITFVYDQSASMDSDAVVNFKEEIERVAKDNFKNQLATLSKSDLKKLKKELIKESNQVREDKSKNPTREDIMQSIALVVDSLKTSR